MAPAPVPAPAPQALPTFNVVLPTVGRASLRRMLSSLQTQLLPADCLTVIFDGGDAAVVAAFQSQLNSFLCRVDLIVEPQRTQRPHQARAVVDAARLCRARRRRRLLRTRSL